MRRSGAGFAREAYLKALECDPVSAFGGVLAFNRPLDAATAEEVAKLFVECIVAPGYDRERARISRQRRICACWRCRAKRAVERELELKPISGGVLVQEPDRPRTCGCELKVATQRAPTRR